MEEEIKILIIEDEPLWLESLAADLDNFGYTVAGTADTFDRAIALLNSTTFDMALLDINIKGRNSGIELGKIITAMYHKPFIFITATQESQIVKDAIEAKPSAYLLKPANPSSFLVAIQNAINNFSNNIEARQSKLPPEDNSFFFVKQGDKYKKIFWQDVVYFRADRNYTFFFNALDKIEYPIRSSLTRTFNYILPPSVQNKFLQVNRSEYVQISFTQELSGDELKTADKTFTISETFEKGLKKHLNIVS
jgi:DNA-binding LytR/AlgR family response regulator